MNFIYKRHIIFFPIFVCSFFQCFSQCDPQSGPPLSAFHFNTGLNNNGGLLSNGNQDPNWQVAIDNLYGTYNPAIVMDSLPPGYFTSGTSRWVSITETGSHFNDKDFYFKTNFNLPCTNKCGKSYDINGTFCLNLDLYCDNSIYEIFVNGKPQSQNLGNIIPVQDPYQAIESDYKHKVTVILCNDWKPGKNTLIIQVASSAPITGLMTMASIIEKPISNEIFDTICNGQIYHFGNQNITKPGTTTQLFHTSFGCDSTIVLNLAVRPSADTQINKAICRGSQFSGYYNTGLYRDTFNATNGCDSIRTINLQVEDFPQPNFGINNELCKGNLQILNPGKFSSYLWQDSSTQSQYFVNKPGYYSVKVTNSCGTATTGITITGKDCHIYFPNAFTPNGDGKNDQFKIITEYQFQEYQLTIINRWGQIVFQTKDPLKAWSGTLNGTKQPSGLFVWLCRYKRLNESVSLNGTVLLIR